jgi:hypothetical protein
MDMKRMLFAVLALTLACTSVFSQSAATFGKIDYQKGEKQVAIIELPYKPDIVEGALKNKLQTALVKEQRLKGMQVFKGARLTSTDGQVADLYFRVDRRGGKEANQSVVYLILGRPNENVALRTPGDAYRLDDARNFLNGLPPVVAAYDLDVKIREQDDLIKKSEKTIRGLSDDQKIYEKRIKDLEEKLAKNRKDQETQTAALAKQRELYNSLISKKDGK